MNWEVCSFLGARRAFPFLTVEVLDVMSACHPAELLGPGSKSLQRQAFAGLVPERHLHRPDKGNWQEDADELPPGVPAAVAPSLAAVTADNVKPVTALEAIAAAVVSALARNLAKAEAAPTN